MRTLGLFIIAVSVLIELMGVGGIVGAFMAPNPPEACFLVGGIICLAAGTTFLALGIYFLRKGKPFTGPTVPSGTRVGNYPAAEPVERKLDGTAYTLLFTPQKKGKNGHPSNLKVSVPVDADGEFEIVPESRFDRLARRWGLTTEIQTGDEVFDRDRFIRTDSTEFTAAYLANPDNRAIIADLHGRGFKSVAMKAGVVSATWVGFDPLVNDTPDLGEEIGARVILLARKLPEDHPPADPTAFLRRRRWQIAIWAGLIPFAVSAFSIGFFPPIRTGDLLLRGAAVFALGYPIGLMLAAWLLRGTSRSHYAWAAVAFGELILFPPGSVGSVAAVNGWGDDSPAVEHRARIVRKYTSKSKNTTNYHVEVESWRDGGTESFKVSSSDYDRIGEGRSHLRVTTKAGRLGMEWLVRKDVEPEPVPLMPKKKR